MKKSAILIIILLFTSVIYSQKRSKKRGTVVKWLSVEVKGGYGISMLMNKDAMTDNNVTMDFVSPAYSYGGRFAITYGNALSISFEMLSSKFNQNYEINDGTNAYIKTQEFKSIDYLALIRYTSEYGFYFEAGPKFSNLKYASVKNSETLNFLNQDNYIENFNEKYNSITAGMGFAIFRTDRLNVNLGLRGSYGFSDIVKVQSFYALNDGVYKPEITSAVSPTNPLSVKFMLGINYFFGFWGDASCGRGRMILFQ